MFKKLILTLLIILTTSLSFAGVTYYIEGKKYILDSREQDILWKCSSMSKCIEIGHTKEECIEIFIALAMERSKEINNIVYVIWVE